MSQEDPRIRVFISSVMDGYANYRDAAAAGVDDAGADPIMAERLPSMTASPRNACLDGVQASDACLVLIGSRGGWTAPSGLSATEEEFEEAQKRGLPILVFVEEVEGRDPVAARLARKASDYVLGRLRRKYTDPRELRAAVAESIRTLRRSMDLPLSDPGRVTELVQEAEERSYDAYVRVVLIPERKGELVAPDQLDAEEFLERLYDIGHSKAVRLFDHAFGKSNTLSRDRALEIKQGEDGHGRRKIAAVYLSESGELAIDVAVEERDLGDQIRSFHSIITADLESALRRGLAFASATLDALDPHERYSALWSAAAVIGAGSRYLYDTPPTGSVSVRMGGEKIVLAEPEPRKLTRAQLRSPEPELQRMMARFRRELGSPQRR